VVFVLTDGYGTTGLQLTRQLVRAEDMGVEVVAMAVGYDRTFVQNVYKSFMCAAHPSYLSNALRDLFEQDSGEIESEPAWA